MTKRKWTTDEDGRLKEMVLSGASLFEIADALDQKPTKSSNTSCRCSNSLTTTSMATTENSLKINSSKYV